MNWVADVSVPGAVLSILHVYNNNNKKVYAQTTLVLSKAQWQELRRHPAKMASSCQLHQRSEFLDP